VDETRELLEQTAAMAADFLASLGDRPVFPQTDADALRAVLDGPLPEDPTDPREVIAALQAGAEPGVVAIPSGRYFGFVIGGSVPAALAADWLTSTWDQNAGLYVGGPSASVVEEVAGSWLRELLGIPAHSSFAFVTGCQMANVTALAAARLRVLAEAGWDVNRDGLAGAPPVRVIVGAKVHVTVIRGLRLLGLGAPVVVDADSQGRMIVESLGERSARTRGRPTRTSGSTSRTTRESPSAHIRARTARRSERRPST
jgi:glutamate/tyrosine decarboxylase-like PLP-dependent enzyme